MDRLVQASQRSALRGSLDRKVTEIIHCVLGSLLIIRVVANQRI